MGVFRVQLSKIVMKVDHVKQGLVCYASGMPKQQTSRLLLIAAFAIALIGGIGAWRYYRIPIELRFSSHDAWWQILPYVLVLLLTIALLLKKDTNGPS